MSDLLARLIAAGTPADLVAEVALELARAQAAQEAIADRRTKDRDRQAAKRSRDNVTSRDITGHSVTSRDVTGYAPLPSPSPLLPPDPQQPPAPTHTPVGVSTRPRKADDFPMPEGCDPAHWRDLLANRKRKNLPNTPTAHKRMMADITRLTDEEWPPGRLVEHAAARGWAAIYDPRQDNRNERPSRHHDTDRGPSNPLVRAGLAFEAQHAPRPETDVH